MSLQKNALAALLAEHLRIDISLLTAKTSLSDIGVDSLEMIELITLIEDTLSIRIDDKQLEKIQSFNDLYSAVAAAPKQPAVDAV